MFYAHEILSMRKKGKLSRCWLAATLSDRMFKKAVSNKVLSTIDITATCNEILKFVNNHSSNDKLRFSLYTSSQLMYGVTKLFKLQVYMFRDSLLRIRMDLTPVIDASSKRKKRTIEATEVNGTINELPPVVLNFRDLQLKEDLHLMPEVDLEILKGYNMRNHVESPNFGALADEELDIMFFNAADIRLRESLDQPGLTIDESRDQPRSPDHTTDMHHFGLSDRLAAAEESRETRTPQKRRSAAAIVDTPTKRLRRGLGREMDAAFENGNEAVSPIELPVDVQPFNGFGELPPDLQDRPPEIFAKLSMDVDAQQVEESTGLQPEAPPAQQPAVDVTAPANDNLQPETQDSDASKAKQAKRVRKIKRIDERTQLPEYQMGKSQFIDPTVHTISWDPPVPDRKRGFSANPLLLQPMTSRSSNHAADGSKWARTLMLNFDICTSGTFVAANDHTTSAEVIRLAESVLHSGSNEISKGLKDTTGTQSSTRDKTAEDAAFPLEHEATTAPPVIPEMHEDVSVEPMNIALVNISDQLALQNISEAPENVPLPEFSVPPIRHSVLENESGTATESIAQLHSNAPESATLNGHSSSDPNTVDVEAFLPRKLRIKDTRKKTRQDSIPAQEAPMEIGDSPTSLSSQQSLHSAWVKPELEAYLEVLWRDRRTLTFKDLAPVEATKRIDAAVCFTLLLELSKDKKIIMRQTEFYGRICITKRTAAAHGMDHDEA